MPRASPRPRCALCRRSPSTRCASSGERNAVPPCQKVYRKRIMKRLVIVFSLLAALAAAAQDRSADLDRAHEEVVAASGALREAEAKRERGVEPLPGEALGTAGRGPAPRPPHGAPLDPLADTRGPAKPALAAIPSDSDDDGRGLAPGFLDAADRVDRFAQPAQLLGGALRVRGLA